MALTTGLADTSLFIAEEVGRPIRRDLVPDQLRVSTITVGELRLGVVTATDPETRERRLDTYMSAVRLVPVPVDEAVARKWALVRIGLRDTSTEARVNDSWIAATALALGIPVVTQDDDYDGIPDLEVISV